MVASSRAVVYLKYTHFISECNFDEHDYAFESSKVKKSGVHERIYSL